MTAVVDDAETVVVVVVVDVATVVGVTSLAMNDAACSDELNVGLLLITSIIVWSRSWRFLVLGAFTVGSNHNSLSC